MNKQIKTLYEHYKNTPKKLKIVCDWDEVIQPCEPYALQLAKEEQGIEIEKEFSQYFKGFWEKNPCRVKYSPYGSKLLSSWIIGYEYGEGGEEKGKDKIPIVEGYTLNVLKEQAETKNSPNFYQQAPFLTIAEDLLKLIKEDKVEKLIFLSAYDKRKFPNGDIRKYEIFTTTFANLAEAFNNPPYIDLQLIPFDSEEKGQTKAEWIKENASDYDLVIDDNPLICNSLVAKWFCKECLSRQEKWFEENKGKSAFFVPCENCIPMRTVISPYYPATAKIATGKQEGYYRDVLLVKQEVSNLKKEDFSK